MNNTSGLSESDQMLIRFMKGEISVDQLDEYSKTLPYAEAIALYRAYQFAVLIGKKLIQEFNKEGIAK